MKAGKTKRIPVILDTDIGTDIDDTWALAMMLKCPELDVKLVVTDTGDTTYRAGIVAKMLQIAGREDIPVGVGLPLAPDEPRQAAWVEGYDLADYPGRVAPDGVQALIDAIMSSDDPVTLVCIGPVPNIAEALAREPRIAERARFVGMHGSIRRSHGGRLGVIAEYNVVAYPEACQKVFSAAWEMTITPLDTCGVVSLDGEDYRRVRDCDDPVTRAVIENYRVWAPDEAPLTRSSILFDTVAVYLAFRDDLLVMEELGIRVTDDGFTVIDESAKRINCAAEWRDLDGFKRLLVARLAGG